jgi:predicted TIM-barrel fold metal-dependent hydrolase
MLLSDYSPRSMLAAAETAVLQPRYPVFEAHSHLELLGGDWIHRPLSELFDTMDQAGVRALVDLDGAWGEDLLERHLDLFKSKAPERFRIFGGVDFSAWTEHGDGFGDWAARRLHAQVRRGAEGLKIWKNLGLHVTDQHGQLVRINDPRLDPIWQAAGELKIPVTIHIADPVAFFEPLDASNERWEELVHHPDWHFPSPPFPPFLDLVEAMRDVVHRHPTVTFIGAHAGCYAENLGWVGRVMEECPNFYIDISARIAELGRQPYSCRRFFLAHADRILFGTDTAAVQPANHRIYYRFLETADEYFPYSLNPIPPVGRWNIYGLDLPAEVLEQVYWKNAEKILGTGTS